MSNRSRRKFNKAIKEATGSTINTEAEVAKKYPTRYAEYVEAIDKRNIAIEGKPPLRR